MTLGFDLRSGRLSAVLVDEDGRIVARAQGGASAAQATDAVASLRSGPVSQVGAAVSDPDDAAAADVVAAAARAAGIGTNPRVVTHGSAIALAEQWRGSARDIPFVAALTAGDEVQAGVVLHGRIFEGAHGRAGGASWLALNPVEREDYRRSGCLDAEVGGPGIVKRIVWRIKAGDRSRVEDMARGDLAAITVEQVLAAARDGDGVAISVVRDTARYIGMAIANLATILDPDIVVVAGLIADAADLLLEPSRAEALRRVSPAMASSLTIAPAQLGADAAAIGAARAAMLG